jgi:peptidoglycan/LPS O-acetylase OafA/YrhL
MPYAVPGSSTRRLPASSSLLLDIVRFGASVTVALGHVTQSHFSTGWPDLTTHAVESVGIFFVLSGFVIRYVTRLKYTRLGEYWIDRGSRIYSVVLPAVLFTIVADWIALQANRGYYLANWGAFMDHPAQRLVQNLLFTSQFWQRSTALFSNGPFWSLSYECLYYVIYGCAFYLRGPWRWLSVTALIALGGAHIALLLPLWVLGCLLYEIYVRLAAWPRRGRLQLAFAAAGFAGVLLWRPVVAGIFTLKQGMARLLLTHHHQPPNLHWMLDYYRVGIPAAFLMLWLLLAVNSLAVPAGARWPGAIRVLAEGTFPLYLVHFPLYVLIAAVVPYNHASVMAKLVMLLTAVAFGVLLAFPTNRLKDAMRSGLRDWFLPGDRMPAARSAETVAT